MIIIKNTSKAELNKICNLRFFIAMKVRRMNNKNIMKAVLSPLIRIVIPASNKKKF